jgi:hypothetical protein
MERLHEYTLVVAMYEHFPEHMRAYYEQIFAWMKRLPNVKFIGGQSNQTLRQIIRESAAYIYPTQFEETSCILARECIEQQTPFLTTSIGALPETLGDSGIYFEDWLHKSGVIEPDRGSDGWCLLFAEFFRDVMRNENELSRARAAMAARDDLGWDGVAQMVEENAEPGDVTHFSRLWSLIQDGDVIPAMALLQPPQVAHPASDRGLQGDRARAATVLRLRSWRHRKILRRLLSREGEDGSQRACLQDQRHRRSLPTDRRGSREARPWLQGLRVWLRTRPRPRPARQGVPEHPVHRLRLLRSRCRSRQQRRPGARSYQSSSGVIDPGRVRLSISCSAPRFSSMSSSRGSCSNKSRDMPRLRRTHPHRAVRRLGTGDLRERCFTLEGALPPLGNRPHDVQGHDRRASQPVDRHVGVRSYRVDASCRQYRVRLRRYTRARSSRSIRLPRHCATARARPAPPRLSPTTTRTRSSVC